MIEQRTKSVYDALLKLTKEDKTGVAYFSVSSVHQNVEEDMKKMEWPRDTETRVSLEVLTSQKLATKVRGVTGLRMLHHVDLYRALVK